MSARRVLYLHSSSGRYGADRQLWLIASGLDRERYQPLVVLPEDGQLRADLEQVGVEVLIRPLAVLRRELMTARGIASVMRAAARDAVGLGALIRRRQIGVVHSNTSVVLSGAAASGAAGVPHVWHVREIFAAFQRGWPVYRRLLGTAAVLPCVSQAAAAQFPAGPRVRVVHDGLAIDLRRAPRAAARAALALEQDVPVLAVLGRISPWKGQDILVRALAEPPLRDRGAIGLIAGDVWRGNEPFLDSLRDLARSLGVTDRLRFLGFREDVETVYGAADVVAVPSTQPDPLPGSAIEAAGAGCAVIASATGGLPEIIREDQTGRLVQAGDPAVLAHAAAELLDDPVLRERLGAAASVDVRERFAPARLLDAIQELYDGLQDGRRTHG